MARKGSRKVRTGCITCKIRKVKCDETKPACNRCITTGRKCDGYQTLPEKPPPTTSLRVPANYAYRVFPGVNISSDEEGRALQYFCETVSPFLSGAVDPYFWTHIVMQFSTFEPSVRHSLVAISNLYEHSEGHSQARMQQQDQRFALQHYNAAIHELKAITSWEKQPVVLIVCVLFICIEFLQANRKAAVRHCTHGVAILRGIGRQFPWTEEHLLPLFRRLIELSFFFGEKSDCPDNTGLERPIPAYFSTYHEAQLMIDDIYNRTFQLLKRCDPYRSGPRRGDPVCESIIEDRHRINYLLDVWRDLFAAFNQQMLHSSAPPTTENLRYPAKMLHGFLVTRYECCRVWLNLALCGDECGFDQFVNNFKRVAKVLNSVVSDPLHHAWLQNRSAQCPKFVFETGFMPMLFSIVATCRHLETRLQILQMMPLLGLPRENLWEKDTLIAVARRMVEIEHSISIDGYGQPLSIPTVSWPPKDRRVLDVSMDSDTEQRIINGQTVNGKEVAFYQRRTDGGIDLRTEFVIISSAPMRRPSSFNTSSPFTLEYSEQCEFIDPALSYSYEAADTVGHAGDSRSETTVTKAPARWKSVAGAYSWDVEYPKQ